MLNSQQMVNFSINKLIGSINLGQTYRIFHKKINNRNVLYFFNFFKFSEKNDI